MRGTEPRFFGVPFLATFESLFAAPLVLRFVMLYSLILKGDVSLYDVHVQFQAAKPVSTVMVNDIIVWEEGFDGAVKAHLINPSLANFRQTLGDTQDVLDVVPDG